jgi:hypothetical protein
MPNNYSSLLQEKLLKIKFNKLDQDLLNFKKAYPNYSDGMIVPGQHNLEKWIQTLKDIYFKENGGMPWKQAFDTSTQGWSDIELQDFNNWVSFYQQKNHLKYKKAQMSWYTPPSDENDADDNLIGQPRQHAGYYLPIETDKESINANLHSDIDFAKDASTEDISPAEKRKLVEKQKKKIISRLDSVEKLLRSDEGHLLTESEFDSLMESIYSLKKKISSLRKKTSGNLFYQDLIIREANILANRGLYKAASFLYVTAEEKTQPTPNAPATPSGKDLPPPATESPQPVELSSAPPPAAPGPVSTAPSGQADQPKNEVSGMPPPQPSASDAVATPNITSTPGENSNVAMEEIAQSLGEGFGNAADDNFVYNESDDSDLVVYDDNDADDYLVAEAQEAIAPPAPAPTPMATPPSPEPVAVTPKESTTPAEITVTEEPSVENSSGFDNKFEDALGQVTIQDVVVKINELSKIFKTREIPRQLALVDMMLDKLGLISFFPSLSEATNKALESNNYILTRIEDISTQLSGAIKTKDIALTPEEEPVPERVGQIKTNLEEQEKLDKERKEKRKELADRALDERAKDESPELEVTEEDLTPAPAAAAIAPVATPPTPPTPVPAPTV